LGQPGAGAPKPNMGQSHPEAGNMAWVAAKMNAINKINDPALFMIHLQLSLYTGELKILAASKAKLFQ
jgi:hypothetical protein